MRFLGANCSLIAIAIACPQKFRDFSESLSGLGNRRGGLSKLLYG